MDDTNRTSFSMVVNFLSLLCSACAAVFGGVSAYLLFSQTPYYIAPKPSLSYSVARSNSNTKNKDTGKYLSTVHVDVTSHSNRPVKDVFLIVRPLPNAEIKITSDYLCHDVSKDPESQRIIRVETIPPQSTVRVSVISYPGSFPLIHMSHLLNRDTNKIPSLWYSYVGKVVKVYTEAGDVTEFKHKNVDQIQMIDDDERTLAGNAKVKAIADLINEMNSLARADDKTTESEIRYYELKNKLNLLVAERKRVQEESFVDDTFNIGDMF